MGLNKLLAKVVMAIASVIVVLGFTAVVATGFCIIGHWFLMVFNFWERVLR